MTGLLYTLGTAGRTVDEFMDILHQYKIQLLVDVRRFPVSRVNHFNRQILERLLSQRGIRYCFLGAELGGYRKGGYEAYTSTREFQEGIEKLEKIAREYNTVIICAERFPWRCHRRWIARCLQQKGWRVMHILDKNRTWESGG